VTTVAEEKERVEKEFHDLHDILLKDKAWTQDQYDRALAKEIDAADVDGTAAYYTAKEDRITIVADALAIVPNARAAYVNKTFSSPSILHAGIHEAVHAAHWRNVRNAAGVPGSGSLSREDWKRTVDQMDAVMGAAESLELGDVASDVSVYATFNLREAAAEYVAGVATGGIARTPAMDSLMEALKAPKPSEFVTPGRKTIGLREARE
jgi:hypothetical protein